MLTRAKSKLLSQQALKLWQQTLAFAVSDIVRLWGLGGRRKLSQPSLSSLITAPPGTASLLSSSLRSHSAQHSVHAVPGQFGFSVRGSLAVSLFHLCLFPWDSTFQLSNFYNVNWAKRRKAGQSKGWFCPDTTILWEALSLSYPEDSIRSSAVRDPDPPGSRKVLPVPTSRFLRTGTLFLVSRGLGLFCDVTAWRCDCLIRGPLLVVSLVRMFPIDSTTNKRKSK